MRRQVTAVLLPLVLSCSSCGGSKVEGALFDGIRTFVEPATVTAGQSATVRCELIGAEPGLEARTEFVVTPAESVAATADALSATAAGTYQVRCSAPGYGVVDPEGATLVVTAGTPARVEPRFDDNPVHVHQETRATCVAVDEFGNDIPIAGSLSADPEVTIAGGVVSSATVGSFEVECVATGLDVQHVPGTLQVVPGQIAQVELRVLPDLPAFQTGAVAKLFWVVTDAWGNELEDLPGTLSAPQGPGIELIDAAEHRYRLVEEGHYTFRVVLDAPHSELSDDITLTVDSTPPEITITWPPRGATLAGDGSPVVIEGSVTEQLGELSAFKINGQSVGIDEAGAFTHPVDPDWGVNLLNVTAVDTNGNSSKLTPTFHYSRSYLPFVDSNAQGLKQDDGIVVLLGQAFLDDGVHDHSQIDDLATLFELLLSELDLQQLVSDSLAGFSQSTTLVDFDDSFGIDSVSWLEVTFHGVLDFEVSAAETTDIGPTWVSIDSRPGGLDFDITMGDGNAQALDVDIEIAVSVNFDISTRACSFLGCLPQSPSTAFGSATLQSGLSIDTFTMALHANIAKAKDGPLEVSYDTFDVQIDTLDIDPIQDVVLQLGTVDLPLVGNQSFSFRLSDLIDLNALLASVIDPLATVFTDVISPLLNPVIEALAGPLIAGLFNAVEIDTQLPLLPLFGEATAPAAELDFYTRLSTVAFDDDGGEIGLAAGFHSERGVVRDPLGAILRDGCLTGESDELAWSWERSVAIGIQTNVINAAIFGAWWTGYLNGPVDVAALGGELPIPIEIHSMEMNWLLPPIVNDCTKSNLLMEIGDLLVTMHGAALGSDFSVTMYADLSLAVSFASTPQGLSVQIGQLLFADAEVISLDDGNIGELLDLRALLEDGLGGILSSFLVGQEFGPIALPATDLSALAPGLPPGTSFGLGNLAITDQEGYVIIGGDLQ